MTIPQIRIIGITGMPEVRPGDDLVEMLLSAAQAQGTPIQNRDVIVLTQKIVSKAEGRLVSLGEVEPSHFARSLATRYDKDPQHVELILRESRRIVRMDRGVILAETRHGFVCANAGVDTSNVSEAGLAALLPEDPDRSAAEIRARLRDRTGDETAIIISDTFGRPWREGCTNIAIGVAGMIPLIDYRGDKDYSGSIMKASLLAVADELSSSVELVMGKINRVPVAIVRGYGYPEGEGQASALVREPETDLFR